MIDLTTVLPARTLDPDSDMARLFAHKGVTPDLTRHRVLATRRLAREIARELPAGPVTLDCAHVEVMSGPFMHELRQLRDDLTFKGMNEDVADVWTMVDERLRDA